MAHSPDFIQLWKDKYTIHSYQVDIRGRATIVALCQLMQESAWQHAKHLGLGFSHLKEKNFIWVLARQLIKISSYPKWSDTIEIQTWPTGKDKLFCYRDFRIIDPDGSLAAEATTTWFVVDLVSRKPQRTALYFHLKLPEDVETILANRLDKLEPLDSEDFTKSIQVSYGDLDMHKHVNNLRYVEWFLNCLPFEFLSAHTLKEIEINYMSEASYQDEISVSYEKKENSNFFHRITRKRDITEICRARTAWASQGR
jgi:acyl-ACP thioesterase